MTVQIGKNSQSLVTQAIQVILDSQERLVTLVIRVFLVTLEFLDTLAHQDIAVFLDTLARQDILDTQESQELLDFLVIQLFHSYGKEHGIVELVT